jgi:hypothetical protein
LAAKLGVAAQYRGPKEIFDALAQECTPFEGMNYEMVGNLGADVVATAKPTPKAVIP